MSHAQDLLPPPASASEHVDDIPLLLAYLQRVGIQRLLDAHFSIDQEDGGLSIGWLTTLWLGHMLSQSAHAPRHLRVWTASHQETLRWCAGRPVRPADVAEARLREVLVALSDDARWSAFEAAINQHILRMYRIAPERVRLKTAAGLWCVTSDGSLQFDQNKRWWPGALPVSVTVATLEPSGLVVMVELEAQSHADRLASEAILKTRSALPPRRMLYVGNGEISSAAARAAIHVGSDSYLCLLNDAGAFFSLEDEEASPPALTPLFSPGANGPDAYVADGYETLAPMAANVDGRLLEWTERRLYVRFHKQVAQQQAQLRDRLARAESAILGLNERKRGKRRPRTIEALHAAAEAILEEYGVQKLLRLTYSETVEERVVRRYRGRPTVTRVERLMEVKAQVDEPAVARLLQRLGWCVYVTTLPAEALTLEQALLADGRAELSFERMRGRPMSLLPGTVQRHEHLRGLVRLLTLALRCLTLLDMTARAHPLEAGASAVQHAEHAQQAGQRLGERLLDGFRDITLTVVGDAPEARAHLTALSALQRRILDMLALPQDIYQLRRYSGQ